MTETVSQAVERAAKAPMAVLDESSGWLSSMLPSHVEIRSFIGMAKAYLRKNTRLAEFANRDASGFVIALSDGARLGLVPGDTFHVLPFENKKEGTIDWTTVIDYTGEIELIYRAGAVASVKAEIVYAKDAFSFQPSMDYPIHTPNWFGDRGEMIGVYAYAVMKDGSTSRVVVMSKAEVEKVKAVSKTKDRADSPWRNWPDRMWLKTAIHQLAKWVPSSAEYIREQLRAAVEADNLRQPTATATVDRSAEPEPDIPDAEIVNEPWPEASKPGEG